jgi:ubiquinol-cytochrome c reductase cytochrome b subunit
LFPLVVLGVLLAVPFAERRLSGDRGMHNLADRPRDAPRRTAFGVAFLSWVFLIFIFGAADRIFVLWGLTYNVQLFVFRIAIWVIPAILYIVTRRWCRALRVAEEVEQVQDSAETEIRARAKARAPTAASGD